MSRIVSSSPPCDMFDVDLEVVSYVNKFVGGPGTGSVELVEVGYPGDTVRSVLERFGERHAALRKALWEGNQIGAHIEVIINDAILGVHHTLEDELRPGDRITLLGQYVGG